MLNLYPIPFPFIILSLSLSLLLLFLLLFKHYWCQDCLHKYQRSEREGGKRDVGRPWESHVTRTDDGLRNVKGHMTHGVRAWENRQLPGLSLYILCPFLTCTLFPLC